MDTQWLAVCGDTQVAVSDVHRFGTDAILLAHFAAPAKGEAVCELGCGCGAVSLRLLTEGEPASVIGVDIAPDAIALAQTSAKAFTGNIKPDFFVADWESPASIGEANTFDRVVVNPPYFASGQGPVNRAPARRTARHETPDTLAAIAGCARFLLKNGGHLTLCQKPEHLPRVLAETAAAGLCPKRLQSVQQKPDSAPWLFLLDCRKNGKPGLTWEPPLILQNPDGSPSAAYREIYHLDKGL